MNCEQCKDPMLKGIHTCGRDGPRAVTHGCTCGSSSGHHYPCPLAPAQSMPPFGLPPLTPTAKPFALTGWICPACGGGVAPAVERCPCKPIKTGG